MVPVTPRVEAGGRELLASQLDSLSSLRVERGLGLIGRASLRFVDAGFALSGSGTFVIGTDVEVSAGDELLIKGVVTAVELEQVGATSTPELVVTVDDKAVRLAASSRTGTYLDATLSSVVSDIAKRHGLSARVSDTALTYDYLLQTGTDLAFLDTLAERSGSVWWVEPDGVLVVARAGTATTTVVKELGIDVLSFAVRATSAAPDTVEVTGWDRKQQRTITERVKVKDRVTTTRPEFTKSATGSPGGGRGWTSAAVVADRAPLSAQEAKAIAGGLADEAAATAVTMTATCVVDHRLTTGVKVEVKGMGPAAGTYLLTRVEHLYTRAGFQTRMTAGPVRPAGLVGLLDRHDVTSGASMQSLVPAVVTNLNGEVKGQVRVKYTTISGEVESAWARVLTLGAGKARGMVFQPEVGDEVLVAFERGDTRRPVVLGGLYSEKIAFPDADAVDQNTVKFRRMTSRQGHTLEFADGAGDADQHVMLTSKKGKHKIRLGHDKLEITVGSVPVVISNGAGAKVEFSQTGDVTISGKNVTIKSDGAVKIEGTTEVALKSSAALKAEGVNVEVKAQAVGKVESAGPLALKGAMVAIN